MSPLPSCRISGHSSRLWEFHFPRRLTNRADGVGFPGSGHGCATPRFPGPRKHRGHDTAPTWPQYVRVPDPNPPRRGFRLASRRDPPPDRATTIHLPRATLNDDRDCARRHPRGDFGAQGDAFQGPAGLSAGFVTFAQARERGVVDTLGSAKIRVSDRRRRPAKMCWSGGGDNSARGARRGRLRWSRCRIGSRQTCTIQLNV